MTWLVTGGAGYIGSHVARSLLESGREVVVLDDLSAGRANRVPAGVPLIEADVTDTEAVRRALTSHQVTGVVHLAARKAVGESVERPVWYYQQNVGGLVSLLDAMAACGVRQFVFSSSAAVYGEPGVPRVTETSAMQPISPYGETKLIGEWLTRDVGLATGLSWLALRYFNVAGTATPLLADDGKANLVPLLMDAYRAGKNARVFGDDYETPDGTCVRDYVHVVDLAEAHVAAALRTEENQSADIVNIGTGRGSSVLDVVASVSRAIGSELPYDVVARRPGDPAELVADVSKAAELLGWTARLTLDDMTSSDAAQ